MRYFGGIFTLFLYPLSQGWSHYGPRVFFIRPAEESLNFWLNIWYEESFCTAVIILVNFFHNYTDYRFVFLIKQIEIIFWWFSCTDYVRPTRLMPQDYDWAFLFHSHTPKTSKIRIFGRYKFTLTSKTPDRLLHWLSGDIYSLLHSWCPT